MTVGLVVVIALGVFVALLVMEAPVAGALMAASVTGLVLNSGVERTGATLGSAASQATDSYSLVVVPMFILMGTLVANAGILSHVFDLAARVTAKLPGGLGIATVLSAASFSAVTGSSAAAVVTLGRMCVTEMRRHGYPVAFAASIVAASGTLGVLIPPSIVLVIYGILTNESIGQLLLAAVVPGLLTAVAYAVTVVLLSVRQRRAPTVDGDDEGPAAGAGPEGGVDAGPGAVAGSGTGPAPDAAEPGGGVGVRQRVTAPAQRSTTVTDLPARSGRGTAVAGAPLVTAEAAAGAAAAAGSGRSRRFSLVEVESLLYIAVIALTVLGGIYGGVFTETEAGAVGALLALVVLLLRGRRTEQGTWRALTSALQETAANTAMLVALLISGSVFTLFLVTTRIPQDLTTWITGLDVNRYVVVLVILLVMLVLGALLDGMSILLLTIPLSYPIIDSLGFDGLWYGILAVKMIEVGLLTPPFGLNVYMISGVVKEAKVESVFRGVVPFILAELGVVALLVAFPEIVTWLPELAKS